MIFFTIYITYNYKLLVKVRKLTIVWYKFKELTLRRNFKYFEKLKKEKNEILIYLYFRTMGLVLMLIINFGIYL